MKVISFSLWGEDHKYCVGAVRNAELAQLLFPDWVCRFYVADDVPIAVQGALANLDNVDMFDMPIEYDGWRGMFSRFLPAAEHDVEVMISRDCDSRLSEREVNAVNEWLESDKGFHTIHDHAYHTVPILGGLWGGKRGFLPEFGSLLDAWPKEDRWQTDQEFLAQEIWPRIQHDVLNHSEFHTNIWPGVPISVPRVGREFIGATYDSNDVIDPEQERLLYG